MPKLLARHKVPDEDAHSSPSHVHEFGLPTPPKKSSDADDRKPNIFRRMFSSNPSINSTSQLPPLTHRCSLVPPNYTPLFSVTHGQVLQLKPCDPTDPLYLSALCERAIRIEISDMYHILQNLDMRPLMLTSQDTSLFFDWFEWFNSIITNVFYLEETALYGWIERVEDLTNEQRKWEDKPDPITGQLSEGRRKKIHGKILALGTEILKSRSNFEGRPVMQELPDLGKGIHSFVAEIDLYFKMKETELPALIEKRFSSKENNSREKKFWAAARDSESTSCALPAIIRSLNRREVRRMKNKFLSPSGKRQLAKWQQNYLEKHSSIVSKFDRLLVQSQSERENQVRENDFARSRAQEQNEGQEECIDYGSGGDDESRAQSRTDTCNDDSVNVSQSVHAVPAV